MSAKLPESIVRHPTIALPGDFTTEKLLGRTLTTCRGAGGCASVFQGSSRTLGQMADACVYVGGGADVDSKAKPTR